MIFKKNILKIKMSKLVLPLKQKTVFTRFNDNNPLEPPSSIEQIELPVITTTISSIANKKPQLLSEKCVTLVFTREQQTISSINFIDINRISEKRSSSQKNKSSQANYTVNELRNFARNIGITNVNLMKKKDLALIIKNKVEQLKSRDA